jgi:hypothetical protein
VKDTYVTEITSPETRFLAALNSEIHFDLKLNFFEDFTRAGFVNVGLWLAVGQKTEGSLVG